jgi:HK97 family phage major capsid protein
MTVTENPTSVEIRSQLLEQADRLHGIRNRPEGERGDNHATELRDAVMAVQSLDAEYSARQRIEADTIAAMAFDAEVARQAAGGESRGVDHGGHGDNAETRTAGAVFTASAEYEASIASAGGRRQHVERGVEVRNLLTGTVAGQTGSNAFAPVGSPFLAPQGVRMRAFRLRDFIPSQSTGLNNIPYIQEVLAVDNETDATSVGEASAKPEVEMLFTQVDAAVRKIAAWIQVTEEAYADAPTLRGYVDTRLAYMLAVEEEAQVLAGNGTAPNISGLTDQTDVQTQAAVADDMVATVGLAIAKVEEVDGMPDAVGINPTTYWTGVIERHSTFVDGGAGGQVLPYGSPPNTILGLPVFRSRVFSANKGMVGDFARGAMIFDRLQTTIKTSDSHASNFVSNILVVLAEERLALAVHRPDFFVDTTFSFT